MAKKYSETFRKNMAPSFKMGFSNDYKYSVPALESVYRRGNKTDWKEIRAEYSRMRDAAQKRLQRLDKSEFSESKAALMHPFGFPKLKEIDERDLPKAMNELFRFLRAGTSTVYGQREAKEKTIEKFNKAGFYKEGFDLHDPENFKNFISVMERVRKLKITYGSDYAREFTEMVMKLPPKQRRSMMAKSRMRKLMQIAHNAELREQYESMAANKGDNLKSEDMDTFIKNMGY